MRTQAAPPQGAGASRRPGQGWQVLVPAKPFGRAKTRCGDLPPERRAELARAMLGDVLSALAGVPAVRGVTVVGSGPDVCAAALAGGAAVATAPGRSGLNAELRQALWSVHEAAPDAALAVVMADLPAAGPEELAAALAAAGRTGSPVVVRDAEGTGTTMLVLRHPDEFRPWLGRGSARRYAADGYRDLALSAGSGLRHDVDTTDGLRALPPAAL
uniref:2-phospho-L-lactate guanylyltransferase n=1 Tax=Streptomyces sp. SM14 TaxID=1736045 RepID=UPI000CD5395F